MQSCIGCICFIFLHCAFSYVSSNDLPQKRQSHCICICICLALSVIFFKIFTLASFETKSRKSISSIATIIGGVIIGLKSDFAEQ